MEYETIAAIALMIAAVAIAHAADVRGQIKELRRINEQQRLDCIELATACGRLMTPRQVLIPAADVDAFLAALDDVDDGEFAQEDVPMDWKEVA